MTNNLLVFKKCCYIILVTAKLVKQTNIYYKINYYTMYIRFYE